MRRGAQTPRVEHHPPYRSSAAEEFIGLAEQSGLRLDPWQRLCLTHGLGENAAGLWAALMVAVWATRQTGKGGICEALELGWLYLTREPLIMHSAHEYKTAQEGYLRIKARIENCPDLDRRVNRYWQANGEQGIELTKKHGGSRLRFMARSRTSGRGFSGSKNIADEGQELVRDQMAAVLPTMSAMVNPQAWFFGTPPKDGTAWCYTLRERAAAGDPRLVYIDFGADLDLTKDADRARVLDRDLWYRHNPALGGRITEDFVASVELPGLGVDLFAAERLGVWPPKAGAGGGAISAEAWARLADPSSRRVGDVAFALDVNPKRTHGAIVAWGRRADGRGHAELVEYRPGTSWLVARCRQMNERHRPLVWVVDGKGPAASLIPELAEVGIVAPAVGVDPPRGCLLVPSSAQVTASCAQLLDAVVEGSFAHIDQGPLNVAVENAKTRPLGDAVAFGRRISTVDIAPLVGVQLARFGFESWREPEMVGGPNLW